MTATLESVAFALTRIVASLDDDPWKEAMRRFGGNYTRAAEAMGIDKSTLHRWRRQHGLEF